VPRGWTVELLWLAHIGDDMEHEEQSSNKLTREQSVGNGIFGSMAGKLKIVGDVVGPVTPLEDWECMRAAAR
jgi:hypothetical protein